MRRCKCCKCESLFCTGSTKQVSKLEKCECIRKERGNQSDKNMIRWKKKAFQTNAREKNKDDEKARRKEQWG